MERRRIPHRLRRRLLRRTERLADAAYELLPDINGYAETFSVFAGEPVHIRAARKVTVTTQASAEHPCATIVRFEIRDAATGKLAAAPEIPGRVDLRAIARQLRGQGRRLFRPRPHWRRKDCRRRCMNACFSTTRATARRTSISTSSPAASTDTISSACCRRSPWQAYNRIGGGCFYDTEPHRRLTISTQRPISRKTDNSSSGALPFLSLVFAGGHPILLHRFLGPASRSFVQTAMRGVMAHFSRMTSTGPTRCAARIERFLDRRGNAVDPCGKYMLVAHQGPRDPP